jgi:hypothetical protein
VYLLSGGGLLSSVSLATKSVSSLTLPFALSQGYCCELCISQMISMGVALPRKTRQIDFADSKLALKNVKRQVTLDTFQRED